MIPHIHLWKRFSSKHRICRLCGEPETFQFSKFVGGYWSSANFDDWVKEYPEQAKIDKQKAQEKAELKVKIKEVYNEDRIKGRAFLKSLNSKKETEKQ